MQAKTKQQRNTGSSFGNHVFSTVNDKHLNLQGNKNINTMYDADEIDFDRDNNINIRDSNVMSSTIGQNDLAATGPLPSLMTQYALDETARKQKSPISRTPMENPSKEIS